ncbi:MAG: hypothetical protein WCX09_02105 [Patescibacteria group bacterium]
MKSEFLISGIETGKLNAMVKNIMTQTGITEPEEVVRMVNAGEVQISVVKSRWIEKDNVIRFSVTSDGTTGPEWIARWVKKGFRVGDYAKSVLCSKDFKPTSGITTEIAILKGMLFEDSNRVTKKIRVEAESRKLTKPNAEVACLIREKFSDKELEAMGLYWIVAMHEPIKDSGGDPGLLSADRSGNGSWLGTGCDGSGIRWYRGNGFAFVVSQVSNS